MKPVIMFVKAVGAVIRKVIEGKRTEAARGRTERLREAREFKEKQSRTGNKSTDW